MTGDANTTRVTPSPNLFIHDILLRLYALRLLGSNPVRERIYYSDVLCVIEIGRSVRLGFHLPSSIFCGKRFFFYFHIQIHACTTRT